MACLDAKDFNGAGPTKVTPASNELRQKTVRGPWNPEPLLHNYKKNISNLNSRGLSSLPASTVSSLCYVVDLPAVLQADCGCAPSKCPLSGVEGVNSPTFLVCELGDKNDLRRGSKLQP